MISKWLAVVAGAMCRDDGLWLMHRRPLAKHHGGLWEFPGGKVEPDEIPAQSLVRELAEELGIKCAPDSFAPVAFAESGGEDVQPHIVILLYMITDWDGDPEALEGGEIGWFTVDEVMMLPKPPLDVSLARQLFQNHVHRQTGLAKRERPL